MVTFFPGEELRRNAQAIVAEFGQLLVFDNGSPPQALHSLEGLKGVELHCLGENLGIAAALNHAAELALEKGWKWLATFDQDSTPEPGFAAAMRREQEAYPRALLIGACLQASGQLRASPLLRAQEKWPFLYERVACGREGLSRVTMVITSGALVRLDIWRTLGGFDEGLFIDYVDTDYCLKLFGREGGIRVCGTALLRHKLGQRENRRILGINFHPTHHAAFRHYTICRNRVRLLCRHGHILHWLFFESVASLVWGSRVVCFERHKFRKIAAMILGTIDGLLGRSGPVPAGKMRWLRGE